MDTVLSADEQAIVEPFDSLFQKFSGPQAVRDFAGRDFDPDLWQRLADVGLLDICAPSAAIDGSILNVMARICMSAGSHLALVPLVECIPAYRLLARSAEGAEVISTLDGRLPVIVQATRAQEDSVVRHLPAGANAMAFVLYTEDRLELHHTSSDRVSRRNACIGGLALADVVLSDQPIVLATGGEAASMATLAEDETRLLAAARLVGAANAALEMGVAYAKTREAFGRPIGAFQALAHRFADVATAVEGATDLTMYAAAQQEMGAARASELGQMAFLFAGETAVDAATASLHAHGGYGFTLEYDIQLYWQRSVAWSLQMGPVSSEWARLTSMLFAPSQ